MIPATGMARVLMAIAMMACMGCGRDSAYIEYHPDANGDKPDIFELGHVQVCTLEARDLPALFDQVDAFARSRSMYLHGIAAPDDRVLLVYTRGTPMRIHLMVERLTQEHYRVGISSHMGAGCDDVCHHAVRHDLCPSNASPRAPVISAASNATAH